MLLQRALGVIATAWLISSASLAAAAGAHQVGTTFFDGDGADSDGFALLTSDGPPKGAGIVANIHDSGAHRLIVGFLDKTEWMKFVGLWNKAIHSPLPSEADMYKINSDTDDSYYDRGSEVNLSVSKEHDGSIDFGFAGVPDSNHEYPTVLGDVHLPPNRIKEFDRDIRTISAFWDVRPIHQRKS